jgi:hypothetical protein
MPHRGWTCINVVDLNPDEEPMDEVEYETCEACGKHPIRFVHTISHPEFRTLDVGRVCVEHLTGDYRNPRRRERELKNRAAARARWLRQPWRISAQGNEWRRVQCHHMVIFPDRDGPGWRCKFDDAYSKISFPTKDAAKLAIHDRLISVTSGGS